jgi:hypothetical protein
VCSGTKNYMQLAREVMKNQNIVVTESEIAHHVEADQ